MAIQKKGDGGKLFFPLRAAVFRKITGADLAETRAGGQCKKQFAVAGGVAHVAKQCIKGLGTQQVADFQLFSLFQNGVQMQVGKLRQNQAVDFRKWLFQKRTQFLLGVFDDVGHEDPSRRTE